MDEDIKSLAAKSLPLFEKGMPDKEKAVEVQHDVFYAMQSFERLSTKTLWFLARMFREAPTKTTETICSVLPTWLFTEAAQGSDLDIAVRNAFAFRSIRLGSNNQCFKMLDKLRAVDGVFAHEALDQLSEADHAWAERILTFLTFSRDTESPVPVETAEFLRDDPENLTKMVEYSLKRGVRINEIDISLLREYLNTKIMPMRDGIL